MSKVLFIIGPTATGKTGLGIELAKRFNGEIISADSRQVYRGMDIGTGKDLSFPQWGLDLCDPDYDFSVSEFRKYAVSKINEIQNRGKLPIIVGGTGFYVKAILSPWETMDIKPDPQLRQRLDRYTVIQLQKKLKKVDLKRWDLMNESDQKNPRRLIRAIEVSGKSAMNHEQRTMNSLIIGLTAPYDYLYERIDKRVEERLKGGIAEEIQELKKFKKLPKTLGYNGESPQEWKFAEHNYARRQMSFFRNLEKEFKIYWFDITRKNYYDDIIKLCYSSDLL
jgi:tRNA dimethylallyltransferase